jgi:hypothetical protein
MAKLKMKYEIISDIPDEYLEILKQNNTIEKRAGIKKQLDDEFSYALLNSKSDLQIEIID